MISKLAKLSISDVLAKLLIFIHAFSVLFVFRKCLIFAEDDFHATVEFLLPIANFMSIQVVAIIFLCSCILALVNFKSDFSIWFSILTGILLMLMTTEGRFAFGYFPTFLLAALTLSNSTQSEKPILSLISLVYLSAAYHKFMNFEFMLTDLYNAALYLMPPELFSVLTTKYIARATSFMVVPIEFSMGILILSPRIRKHVFLLCCVFHLSVGFLFVKDGVPFVSLYWFLAHCMLASFTSNASIDRRTTCQELFSSKYAYAIVVAYLAILTLYITNALSPFFNAVFRSLALYLPILILTGLFYFGKNEKDPIEKCKEIKASNRICILQVVWISVLLLWSFFPVLTNYKNISLGWAMFSGGYFRNEKFCFVVATVNPKSLEQLIPVIRAKEKSQGIYELFSFDRFQLEKYHEHLLRRGDGAIKTSIYSCK